MRRRKRWKWLLPPLIALLLAIFFLWQQNGIVTEVYTVPVGSLPAAFDGFRIVQISDLHGKEFGEDNAKLLKAVAELQPDLIAITGDLIDQAEQLDMVPPLAKGLSQIAPTCYVTGNHEWAVRKVNALKAILRDNGVTVLTNSCITLERDGQPLVIAGVDDPNGPLGQKSGQELRQEIAAEYGNTSVVLLAHRDSVDEYAGWGYDLVLCGHGHGGVIRIPILNKGLLSTDRTLFPEFDGGLYRFLDGGACVVSRGLGSNTVPIRAFRLFNRPDLPLIILQSA